MLSIEQKKIADNLGARNCILAGAGSGKTRTLIQLILNDIVNGIPPEKIVGFTFTNKAAEELLARIKRYATNQGITQSLDGLFLGTIHSWCFNFLEQDIRYVNYESLDELHLYTLLNRLYEPLNLEEIYGEQYPKPIHLFISDLEVFYNESLEESALPENIFDAIHQFRSILEDNRLLTFGEMIRQASQLLKEGSSESKVSSLYVDEYQDVNTSQVDLIKLMIDNESKLTVVGDDLQSIYNWRGRDVSRILNLSADFHRAHTFRLTDNYRSSSRIVEYCNLIAERITITRL